jgi:hypothetical protein
MIRKLLAIAGLSIATPAMAAEIDVAGTTVGALTFTVEPGQTLSLMSSYGFAGSAGYTPTVGAPDSGIALFEPFGLFTGPDIGGGVFIPTSPVQEIFSYQSIVGPDTLLAAITWNKIVANAPLGEPQLFGTGMVKTSSGDPDFVSDFPVDGGFSAVAMFPLDGTTCDLVRLAQSECSVSVERVSFEGSNLIDTPPSVPEPRLTWLACLPLCIAAAGFARPGGRRRTPSYSAEELAASSLAAVVVVAEFAGEPR